MPTYRWATRGDLNAFFGLMLDNVTNLVMLTGILAGVFKFPVDIIFTRMIPGTAFGVLIGDLIYTWMAFRLAKKTGRDNVTAMPLGLDTPSTIGIAFAVLGPSYLATGDAVLTWQIGMATMVFMGLVKVAASFLGSWIRRVVPQAGLLGSLAGIGLALLSFLPLIEIFKAPIVGLVALGLILYSLVARLDLPWRIPGAFGAVAAGAALYYLLAGLHIGGYELKHIDWSLRFALPLPTLGFVAGIPEALKFLPIAIPFGILTIVGGINVTESAAVAGDAYNTRNILLTEAFATLIAGVCGGVAQSTPYIGHPAYKAMGGRAAYTLATGLFIGLGGVFGYISVIVDVIPVAAVAPILIFVGLEIITQAFESCPAKHMPAVSFSFLPTIANLVLIEAGSILGGLGKTVADLPADTASTLNVITALGHGFILTAMLWGAFAAHLIDRRLRLCSLFLFVCAALTLFGFIHSVAPNGEIYLPWKAGSFTPYEFSAGYGLLGILMLALSLRRS